MLNRLFQMKYTTLVYYVNKAEDGGRKLHLEEYPTLGEAIKHLLGTIYFEYKDTYYHDPMLTKAVRIKVIEDIIKHLSKNNSIWKHTNQGIGSGILIKILNNTDGIDYQPIIYDARALNTFR